MGALHLFWGGNAARIAPATPCQRPLCSLAEPTTGTAARRAEKATPPHPTTLPPAEVAFLLPSMNITVTGGCRETMRDWAADGVRAQMCVTSPPYFGLRSYMPNGVRLKHGLPDAVREAVIAELSSLGIHPTTD